MRSAESRIRHLCRSLESELSGSFLYASERIAHLKVDAALVGDVPLPQLVTGNPQDGRCALPHSVDLLRYRNLSCALQVAARDADAEQHIH